MTTLEIIDQIHELILEARRISSQSIAEQLGISRERFGSNINEDLDMQKLSAKWVPKCLNADQKRQRCQSFEQILKFFQRDLNDFVLRLLTKDENWLYHYDPETKQQSMEWRYSGSQRPPPPKKKFQVQKSPGKFLDSFCWDQEGILLTDFLPKGQIINAEYYSALLVILKDILKEKRHLKVTKGFLFLHENAMAHRAHAAQKELAYLDFQYLDHPPYSPDVPVGIQPVPWIEKTIENRHFSSYAEVIAAAETWLDEQPCDIFEWLAKVRATD